MPSQQPDPVHTRTLLDEAERRLNANIPRSPRSPAALERADRQIQENRQLMEALRAAFNHQP